MYRLLTSQKVVFYLLTALLVHLAPAGAANLTANWTGAGGTNLWSDPDNWDIAAAPLNGMDTFDVVIPAGVTVRYDVDGAGFVTDLSLAAGSTLIIDPGESLTVLDDAAIDGTIQAAGASTSFLSAAPGSVLGNAARLSATGEAQIATAATTYASTGENNNVTLFAADGYDSRVDLSSLQSLDARFNAGYRTHTISATNFGVIDMSWLGTLYGATNNTSSLLVHIGSGGYVNLYNLTDILGGYTRFDIDVPWYALNSLQTANGVTFDVSDTTVLDLPSLVTVSNSSFVIADGGAVNAPALQTLTNSQLTLNPSKGFVSGVLTSLDMSRINLTEGAGFGVQFGNLAATSYSAAGLNGNHTIFSADGANSHLDLSSLEILDGRFTAGYRTQTVSATDSGYIDLSSVTTIHGAVSDTSRLHFGIASAGSVHLSALTTIPDGYTTFNIDVPSFTLDALQTAFGATFDASNITTIDLPALTSLAGGTIVIEPGGKVNAPQMTSFTGSYVALTPDRTFVTAALSNVDNSRFILTEGAQFSNITAGGYSLIGLNSNNTIFSADGTGTLLNLSSFAVLDGRFTAGYRTNTISATASGAIDLSGVQTIYGATSDTSRLNIHIDSGGDVDLTSVVQIPAGYTTFDIDVPSYSLPALETAFGATFDAANVTTISLPVLTDLTSGAIVIQDGGTISAPSLTSLTHSQLTLNPDRTFVSGMLGNVDNSRLNLSGGAQFANVSATTYTSTGLNGNYTLFNVDGDGTLLDLSSLNTLNAQFTAGYRTQTIAAANRAVIDFSGLGLIIGAPNATSALNISIDSGAGILFGDGLSVTGHTNINIHGPGAGISVAGDLEMNAPARLIVTEGGTVAIGGDFTFNTTDETAINLDAAVLTIAGDDASTLEAGAEDLGLGGATAGNFGIGRLVVGDGVRPTRLHLADLVDNGNRNAGNEALYLYGSGALSGMRIAAGSTLVIGNINVYVYTGEEWLHINSLFAPGIKWIPFDEGKITLTEYECTLTADLNGDCFVNVEDLAVLAAEWLECGDLQCP